MKRISIAIGSILVSILVLPILMVYLGGYYDPGYKEQISRQNIDKIQEISRFEEEIISILAKEIPPYYEDEALKAQAVIVRTYLLRRQAGLVDEGSLSYLSQSEMKALWQQDYDENYSRYKQAVMDTQDEVIYYAQEMIEPIYHRANNGITRDPKSIYDFDIPYLQVVENQYDSVGTKVVKQRDEIVEELKEVYPDMIVDSELLEYQLQVVGKDASGYISYVQIGNILLTGEELRNILELPSSNFWIEVVEDEFIFNVYGIGHGVGLSQNGANELAKQGFCYDQILEYYYKDIQIKKFE